MIPTNFHPIILLLIKYDYNQIFSSFEKFLYCFNELKDYDQFYLNNKIFNNKSLNKLNIISLLIDAVQNQDQIEEEFLNFINKQIYQFDLIEYVDNQIGNNLDNEIIKKEYIKLNDNLETFNKKLFKFEQILNSLQEKDFLKKLKSNENLKIDLFRSIFDLFYNEDKLISFSKNKSYIPNTYYKLLESFSLRDIKFIINGINKIDFIEFKEEVMKNSRSSIDDLVNLYHQLPNSNDLLTKEIIYEKLEICKFIKDQAKNNKYYLKNFLEFMTGSNSLPVGGYESYKYPLKFRIYYDSNGATGKKLQFLHVKIV